MVKQQKTFIFFEHCETGSELVGRFNSKHRFNNEGTNEICDALKDALTGKIRPIEISASDIQNEIIKRK